MFRHLLPNALTPAIVQISISIGMAILLTAGLSFVGAGVRMPTPEWGLMVSIGAQQMILGVWWVALFPGLAILLSVLCFALLGDAAKVLADPDNRGRGDAVRRLLEVQGLSVAFGPRTALDDVAFTLQRNEILGIVGETGAGKSVLARALIDLLPGSGQVTAGDVLSRGPLPARAAARGSPPAPRRPHRA